MNGYELDKDWFENTYEMAHINASHTGLYMYIKNLWNILGQPKEFGLPTMLAMQALKIKSANTYNKLLNEVLETGAIIMIEKSQNQYTANRIGIAKFKSAHKSAHKSAVIWQGSKHEDSTQVSTDNIIEPITYNLETNNNESSEKTFSPPAPEKKEGDASVKTEKKIRQVFKPPALDEVERYFGEKRGMLWAAGEVPREAQKFINFYSTKGWMVGKNKMVSWQHCVNNWITRKEEDGNKQFKQKGNGSNLQDAAARAYADIYGNGGD